VRPGSTLRVSARPPSSCLSGRYGKERPSFYLIRPDGYVMLRGTPVDADKAALFCRQFSYRTPM